jgi:hypothetical protein
MELQKKEIENFFKLHKSLLFYVNQKKNLIKGISSVSEFKGEILNEVVKLRGYVVKDYDLIDSFIKENPFQFNPEELKTIECWKKGIYGTFYIVKYEKGYTYFYHPETKKCYGVLSLFDQLEDMLGSYLPIIVDAWIIPYQGKIVYDSLIIPYRVSFGGNMRRSTKSEYKEAIIKHGLITRFENSSEKKETSDGELLKFYMKSEANRDRYWKEIEILGKKNPELKNVYFQEWGRINSRTIKKNLKATDIKNAWFAVLDNVIVASGKNKKGLLDNMEKILPENKKEYIYVFKI